MFKTPIDTEIERCIEAMSQMQVGTTEYSAAANQLKVLYEARGVKNPSSLSTDTMVSVGANIMSIVLVLYFERFEIVTSKAF
jgi:hypothetical protein